jgi:predicted permease
MLRVFAARVRTLLADRNTEPEFDDEVQTHLQMLAERFESQGMPAKDAASAARRQFGNATLLQQKQREARSFVSLSNLWRDVRFGGRMLRRNPGSNAAVVVALALGIGMISAMFSFVNALLLRPPVGVQTPGTLLEIWQHNRGSAGIESYLPFTYPGYIEYRDRNRSFSGLVAFDGDDASAIWNRAGEGEVIQGRLVSGNFFAQLGVNAALGRTLAEADDRAGAPQPLVVLSDSFWRNRMGADLGVVGKTMTLNGASFRVVGVAPAGFEGVLVANEPDFWAPLTMQAQFTRDPGRMTDRQSYWLMVAGRLRAGVDAAQAQAEMHVLARQLEAEHPDSNRNIDAQVYPAGLVPGPFRTYVRAFTGLLMAVFGLVLLIACTNAASLLLARATGRAREMAIRQALGAGRRRLIRQLMVESLLLSSIAGAAGVGLAWWMAHLLMALKPASLPLSLRVPLDWRVLLFTCVVSVLTGMVFGMIPALRSTRVQAAPVLKEETQSGSVRKSRLRSVLMIGEIATCVVLLTGATLCVRSLGNANSIDPGFDTHHIAMATLDPASLGYSDAKSEIFYRDLLEHVRALPHVTAVSYVDHLPLGTAREATVIGRQPGVKQNLTAADVFRVGPGYFATMGIPLLRGRDFTPSELGSGPATVAVVNDALARKMWPGREAVGQRMAIGDQKIATEVIGVVKTGKYRTLGEELVPVLYRVTLQARRTLLVRSSGDARPLLDAVRREVQSVDPSMAATDVETIEQYMAFPLFPARAIGLLLGASGILAVVLTAIGLFGVIAFVVSQQTHAIGIRMALGASRKDVLKLVVQQGLLITAIGLAIGLGAALAAMRLLAVLLYGIRPDDPLTFLGVSVGLTAVALLACYIPARIAMRIDPMTALRYE